MKKIFVALTMILLTLTEYQCHPNKKIKNEQNNHLENSFDRLKMGLKLFQNHYELGDTISALSLIKLGDRIDTTLLKEFDLFASSLNLQRSAWGKEFDCGFLGQYRSKEYSLILTRARVSLSREDPVLSLLIFSDEGELTDLLKIHLNYPHDPDVPPETKFLITKDFLVLVDQVDWETKKYRIDERGHFIEL